MAYPAKTDREAILAVAIAQAAASGPQGISVRSVATALGLAPNAIYRYFRDRAELEAAVSEAVTITLHRALETAVAKKSPEAAIRALARSYVEFARSERGLYQLFMLCETDDPARNAAHNALWEFVLTQVARLTGKRAAAPAATALWAFLHGTATLEELGALDPSEPEANLRFGLQAWLAYAGRTKR